MSGKPRAATEFSVADAHQLLRDLFEPNPWIYGADLLITAAVALLALVLLNTVANVFVAAGSFVVAVFSIYRLAAFTHELTHLREGTFGVFRAVWVLIAGIPLLMPDYFYETHRDHHRKNGYGTPEDGEYLRLAYGPVAAILLYLAQVPAIPFLAAFRFGILTPFSWLHPAFRRWMWQHATSLVMDPRYVRPLPPANVRGYWIAQELGCCAVVWGFFAAWWFELIPWGNPLSLYAIAVCILTINALRTLAAHRFRSTGEPMSHVDQLLDSVNVPGRPGWEWLTELWAPVGLRFHALHHLFPAIPYHSLGTAHARLIAALPADSVYHQTVSPGLWPALRQLWRDAAAGGPQNLPAEEVSEDFRA